MKKRSLIFFMIFMLLGTFLGGCGNSSKENPAVAGTDKSIYEHGLDLIALMEAMVQSEVYSDMMTSSGEISALAEEMRSGDYTVPEKVFVISIPEDCLEMLLSAWGEEKELREELPAPLYDSLNKKITTAFVNQFNAQSGATYLALSSIYTASKTFVSTELEKDVIYLYTFENGYPIFVTFVKGEGGAVAATGGFLMNQDIELQTAEDVENLLDAVGFQTEGTVEELKK